MQNNGTSKTGIKTIGGGGFKQNGLKTIISGLLILSLILGLSGGVSAGCAYPPGGPYTGHFVCGQTITQSCEMNESLTTTGTCFTVGANDIVIDGKGFNITGDGGVGDDGIILINRNNVTIKNFNIFKFNMGIYLGSSSNNNLTNNTASNNGASGIELFYNSSHNRLTNNTANNNDLIGIIIHGEGFNPANNTLIGNTANNNERGIQVGYGAQNNTVTNNTANYNQLHGLVIWGSGAINNEINQNEFCSNNQSGGDYYDIYDLNSNTYSDNTCNSSGPDGLCANPCVAAPPPTCTDNDHDGYNQSGAGCGPVDCNDNNASIHPGAAEVCNGVDDNCVNGIDEGGVCGGGFVVVNLPPGFAAVLANNPNVDVTSDDQNGIYNVSIKNGTTNVTICEVEINFTGSDPNFTSLIAEIGDYSGTGYGICHFGDELAAHKAPGSYKVLYVQAVKGCGGVCLLNQSNPTASSTVSASASPDTCSAAGGEWISGLAAVNGYYKIHAGNVNSVALLLHTNGAECCGAAQEVPALNSIGILILSVLAMALGIARIKRKD